MRRWLSRVRWGTAPIVILSLVLATLMVELTKPDNAFEQRVPVALGAWGRVDAAVEVQVTQVRTGSTLLKVSGNPMGVSQGEYVVVTVVMRVDRVPQGMVLAEVRTSDGIAHRTSLTPSYEPGFSVTSDVPFEIPRDRLAGAVFTLRVTRSLIAYERVVAIDLGFTDDKVAGLPAYATVRLADDKREVYR